ncbi:hypothetical protein AX15_004984 [Amanita polypyramis BW_CC]|nr:hypothetical protein AX15_004984 [Amanita polypyramis BW_CC]
MDEPSAPASDTTFLTSSVSSVLGVKGPLRFRPRGSNQKAHVILRRVTLSDNSNDNGDLSAVVHFSLFAQKRIEVKPGKEILLTVASEDGKFTDLPIVFEGDRATPQTSEEDGTTQFADEERHESCNSRVSQTMPPKMRRAWTKKLEVSPSVEELSSPSTSRTSIGIQAEPLYVHSCIQTQVANNSIATGTEPIYDSGNFPGKVSLSSGDSAAASVSSPRRYVSLKVQTDPDVRLTEAARLADRSVHGMTPNDTSVINQESEFGRSLSPMELDSSPCSREASSSPAVSAKQIEIDAQGDQFARPPSPSSSIASSSGAQDMQLSPVGSRSSSTIIKVTSPIPPQANGSYPAYSIGTHSKSHVQNSAVSQLSPHYSNLNATSQPLSMSYGLDFSQKASQKQGDILTLVSSAPKIISSRPTPVVPSKRVFPATKSALSSTTLSINQDSEYSPRDPFFKESALTGGWNSYSNSAQMSAASGHLPRNAVASSSKVMLEHAGDPHRTFDAKMALSDQAQGGVPNGTALTGLSKSKVSNQAQSLGARFCSSFAFNLSLDRVTGYGRDGDVDDDRQLADASLSSPEESSHALRLGIQVMPSASYAPQPASSLVENQMNTISIPVKSPVRSATPAEVDNTVTSWLSTFDDHYWDADAVPGLTASYNLKSRIQSQKIDKSMSAGDGEMNFSSDGANSAHHEPASQQTNKEAYSLDSGLLRDMPNGSVQTQCTNSPNCIADGQLNRLTNQLGATNAALSLTDRPGIPVLGAVETSFPSYSMAVCRPCPAERSASPRGVKRERPPTPMTTSPLNEVLDMVDVDGASGYRYSWQEVRRLDCPVFKCDYSANLSGAGNLAVQAIAFCSDGSHFALSCADKTLRIWNNTRRAEIARLSHNSPIVGVTWLEGDIGVVTLGEDGIVGKWTRVGGNFWQWAKIVDAGCEKGPDEKTCLAYHRDRIAVSFPRTGVKMWIWLKGTRRITCSCFQIDQCDRYMASSEINCSPKRNGDKVRR